MADLVIGCMMPSADERSVHILEKTYRLTIKALSLCPGIKTVHIDKANQIAQVDVLYVPRIANVYLASMGGSFMTAYRVLARMVQQKLKGETVMLEGTAVELPKIVHHTLDIFPHSERTTKNLIKVADLVVTPAQRPDFEWLECPSVSVQYFTDLWPQLHAQDLETVSVPINVRYASKSVSW